MDTGDEGDEPGAGSVQPKGPGRDYVRQPFTPDEIIETWKLRGRPGKRPWFLAIFSGHERWRAPRCMGRPGRCWRRDGGGGGGGGGW